MSTDRQSSGNGSIEGYSADYRSVHAESPKKEPKRPDRNGEKPDLSKKRRKEEPAHPSKSKKKAPEPSKPAPADRMDNETEIDDFLPESDSLKEERLLTKWDDGMEPEKSPAPPVKRRGRYRYGIFVGTLVLLLALTGVGFLAVTAGQKIHAALTDDSRLRAYDKFLTVIVAQDPQPFSSPDKADPGFVLNASLWRTMTEDNGTGYTDYDDAGRTIVPLGDVVDACHELFGPSCQLQPKNSTEETFFEYDAAKAQFHVSLYSLDSTYAPYTESAKKSGDGTLLRVGYVPPSDETRVQSSPSSTGKPKPTKYMEYLLKTNPSTQKEYVSAVRIPKD